MFGKVKKLHFVGIGGIGMSGIAELLLSMGFEISGSDISENEQTKRLQELGAKIYKGHSQGNVEGAQVVVISSAIRPDNIEVLRARELKIPVIRRAEMLSELMRMKYGIAVAGSHGKTTTTSMIASAMIDAEFDPTVIVGGKVLDLGSNARLGQSEYLVAEADESDGTFLMLMPYIAVITNVDKEHLDYYKDYQSIIKAFTEFGNHVPFYGVTLICGDDRGSKEVIPFLKRRFRTYGFEESNDIRAFEIFRKGRGFTFKVKSGNNYLGEFSIAIPGKHNILNALAVIGVAEELEVPQEIVKKSLGKFSGVKRRLEVIHSDEHFIIVDDYGHHPTEIRATIDTLKEMYPERRIVVAFQPHRYTRTRDLIDEFADGFEKADLLVLTDIYSAGEKPIEGISGESLYWKIRKVMNNRVLFGATLVDVVSILKDVLESGDVLLTLGAGNIYRVAEEIKEWIQKQ